MSSGLHLTFIIFYWASSLFIATISTALIVYRTIGMARRSKITLHCAIIEILVESGAMYTVLIITCCSLWAIPQPPPNASPSSGYKAAVEASGILYSLLIPITVSLAVSAIYLVGAQ